MLQPKNAKTYEILRICDNFGDKQPFSKPEPETN